jgi:Fe-S-cluster containining protein
MLNLRVKFPEEKKFPWLSVLLDACAVIDKGVASAIKKEKKRGMRLACKRGCSNCCRTHTDIPLYPLEATGIYWYCTEKIKDGHVREILKKQLKEHVNGPPCPFLIEDACSIHPVRPVACRQFNVFGAPCAPGEDPFFTRRDEVLTPIKEFTDRAFYIMLPFYGITAEEDRRLAIKNQFLHTQAINLQEYGWQKLASLMEGFEKR